MHHEILQPVSDPEFSELLMAGVELLKQHGAQKWLSDDRRRLAMSDEWEKWGFEVWLPLAMQAGWRYWAIVKPQTAISRMNMARLERKVTTLIEDLARGGVTAQFFDQPEEALAWLESQ